MNTNNTSIAQLLIAAHDCFLKSDFDTAIVNATNILMQDINHISALRLLAACYYLQKKYDLVLETTQKIIDLQQAGSVDYFNLAHINHLKNQLDLALDQCLAGLKLDPNNFNGLNMLSDIYLAQNNMELAENTLNLIMSLYPQNINKNILFKLSQCHRYFCHYEQAISTLLQTLPNLEEVSEKIAIYNDLGYCYDRSGNSDEATIYFKKIFEMEPLLDTSLDLSGAHVNLAFLLLNLKNYREGWSEYEFRLLQSNSVFYHNPIDSALKWDGSNLNNKTLLLHYEQGFGDNIHFIRYAKLIKQRYPQVKILFFCPPALVRLLSRITDIDGILSKMPDNKHIDYVMPLLSIPFYFKLYDESCFMPAPYLTADPTLLEEWRSFFSKNSSFKIGINWACDKNNVNFAVRSCKLSDFLFMQDLPNITIYNLQFNISDDDATLLKQSRIVDLTKHISDFADTAAAISHLDLIISVDTVTIHLAGALGKPTWLLLSYFTEWRFPRANEDKTLWYNSVSIIRQTIPRDWSSVFAELKLRLATPLPFTG